MLTKIEKFSIYLYKHKTGYGKTTRRLPIVERDEWLLPAEQELNNRHERYMDKMNAIVQAAGSLVDYANGYRYFGWQRDETLDGWWLREWLPGAHDVYVFGDFNNWQRTEIRMQRDRHGVWSAFFPTAMYRDRLVHGSLYKLHVHGDNGWLDRIPAYATRVVQDEATKNYTAQFWAPEPFDWRGDAFDISKTGTSSSTRHTWAWRRRRRASEPTANSRRRYYL